MEIKTFFDKRTYTLTYVVVDSETRDAVIIDPVLDYDPAAAKTWTESVDDVLAYTKDQNLNVRYVLETHAHADHLSGSQRVKTAYPDAILAIGSKITTVQEAFKTVFDLPADFPTDGRQFDRLLADGETFEAGSLVFRTIHTPGHTPACVTYQVGDAVFTGDAVFMPDQGTGRCDFPGGSSTDLYHSVAKRLYELPPETRVFVGHDYQPGGRELAFESTIGEQMEKNVQLPAGKREADFVRSRDARDATLGAPKLLFQSVQVNVDAGTLPTAHDNGIAYLKIPLNVFRPEPAGEIEEKRV